MAWISLAEDRDRWQGLVSAAMNFGFQKCGEIFD
jgi:hypothetical protein